MSLMPMSIMLVSMMLIIVVLMSLTLAGCSQHDGTPTPSEAASMDQHLPFDGRSDKAGIFPTGSLTPTAIPAGTPLAVHLQNVASRARLRGPATPSKPRSMNPSRFAGGSWRPAAQKSPASYWMQGPLANYRRRAICAWR